MKLIFLGLSFFLSMASWSADLIEVVSKVPGGSWTEPETWIGGVVPVNTIEAKYAVTILPGSTVNLAQNPAISRLVLGGTIEGIGTLQVEEQGGLLDGAIVLLDGGVEFLNEFTASGKVYSRGPLIVRKNGALNQAELTLSRDSGYFFDFDAFLQIETGAVLAVNSSSVRLMEKELIGDLNDNGIINKGTISVNSGPSYLFLRANEGIIDGKNAKLDIQAESALSGTYRFSSGSLTIEAPNVSNADIQGQGTLRIVGESCQIQGGTLWANQLIVDGTGASILYLQNIYNVIIGQLEVESGAWLNASNSIYWIQQKTTLRNDASMSSSNSHAVCPLIEGTGSRVSLNGRFDGNLQLLGGQITLGSELEVNGDILLDPTCELKVFINKKIDPAPITINGELNATGPMTVEFGMNFFGNTETSALIHADTLTLNLEPSGKPIQANNYTRGRLYLDASSSTLELVDIVTVKHPWVWFIIDAGGDPVTGEWAGLEDYDNDGTLNYEEFAFGSNPADKSDRPKILLHLEPTGSSSNPSNVFLDLKTLVETDLGGLPPVNLLISHDLVNWGNLGLGIEGVFYPDDEPHFTFFRHFFINPPWETFFVRPVVDPVFIDKYNELLGRAGF